MMAIIGAFILKAINMLNFVCATLSSIKTLSYIGY